MTTRGRCCGTNGIVVRADWSYFDEATLNHGYDAIRPVDNQPGCSVSEILLSQTAILTASSMVYRSYRIGKLHRVHAHV